LLPIVSQNAFPVLDTAQTKELDQAMVKLMSISILQMMECAGESTAFLVRELLNSVEDKALTICCGKGHNGGDGFVAARHLHNWGANVTVVLAADEGTLHDAPLRHFKTLQSLSIPIIRQPSDWDAVLSDSDLIVDALLGYGLTDSPRPPYDSLISLINGATATVLALDIPSGLDSGSGTAYPPCVEADVTVTLACIKTGIIVPSAKPYVGELYVADIGVPPNLFKRLGLLTPPPFSQSRVFRVGEK